MHMADALISPAVGGTMWAAAGALIAYSAGKVGDEADERKVPLMGVLGAFVFAAQMMNFTIPGTGSSGHMVGGLLLAILLGPYAGFLVLASVLTVQALFFADGGLLALGCNIVNMGFFTCFAAYPLYRWLAGDDSRKGRILAAATAAAAFAMALGASGVVADTVLSGVSELPLGTFALLMVPIHLIIGLAEGVITAGVVSFVLKARPELLRQADPAPAAMSLRRLLLVFAAAAAVTGGALSWFASRAPERMDSAMPAMRPFSAARPGSLRAFLAGLQERTSFLPDYGFRKPAEAAPVVEGSRWPSAEVATTLSGLVGGLLTLLLAGLAGLALRRRQRAPGA